MVPTAEEGSTAGRDESLRSKARTIDLMSLGHNRFGFIPARTDALTRDGRHEEVIKRGSSYFTYSLCATTRRTHQLHACPDEQRQLPVAALARWDQPADRMPAAELDGRG